MAQIVIVDDHELIAESLRIALRAVDFDAEMVIPTDHAELLANVLEHRPTLVLLDLELGQFGDATPLIAPLVAAGVRVLVVSGTPDRLRIAEALEQGALGYRSKSDGFAALVETVRRAYDCRSALDLESRSELLEELRIARSEQARTLAPFTRLTDREQDTLRLMARGYRAQDIAGEWVVSVPTVRSHVHSVLTKLGVRTQLAAVALAIQSCWLDVPVQQNQRTLTPTR